MKAHEQLAARIAVLAEKKPALWVTLLESLVRHKSEIVADLGDDGTVEGGLKAISAAAQSLYEEHFAPLQIAGVPESIERKWVEPAVLELIDTATRHGYESL